MFHSKVDSITQNFADIMKRLLASLVCLTFVTQIIIEFFFGGVFVENLRYIAFVPVYLTLIGSYILLWLNWKKLAVHFFLIGLVVDQFLIMAGSTGPLTYVYVSYTNIILVAGIILGPSLGLVYTIFIVFILSLYMYLISHGMIEELSMDDVPYGSEMEFLAAIACFIFTGLTIYYSVFKMENLYRSAVEEKQNADTSYRAMKEAQFRNEIRAKHGVAIGELSQRIVQYKKISEYVQITAEEIQKILRVDVALILLPSDKKLVIEGYSCQDPEKAEGLNQKWLEISSIEERHDIVMERMKDLLCKEDVDGSYLNYSYVVPLFDTNHDMGWIVVFSAQDFVVPLDEFLTTISGILTSSFYRTKAEEQLRRSQKMETIGLLAGGMAHDFNNVLTAILGNAEVAFSHVQSPEIVKTHLSQISRASNHAASLTHKLLTLTKKTIHQPTTVDVNTILRDMEGMLQPLFSPNMSLQINYCTRAPTVYMDSKDLESMLLNLILNAKDAISSDGTVEIFITLRSSQQEMVQIEVRDNGSGMTEQVRDSLFEPFFTTKSEGTGLGLTMVHSIVQGAKGKIVVKSKIGEGSSLVIQIPYDHRNLETIQILKSIDIQENRRSHKTILIVDDNDEVRNILVEMVSMSGYMSLGASSGPKALQVLQHQNIDFILSDSIMPECSGMDFFDQLQEAYSEKQIPFALMTGFSSNQEDFKHRNITILEKPISSTDLIPLFDQALFTQKNS